MTISFRIAPLALICLPLIGRAQLRPMSAVGLEIPAPVAAGRNHFLTGAYVSGSYTPLLATGGVGYAVQPYLRYTIGTARRARPFVQYSFMPFWVQQGYGSIGSPYGVSGVELPANPGFAPLASRNAPYSSSYGYGGLSGLSVGVPMRVGKGSMLLNVGGNLLGSVLGLRP